ncbi:unnamed protein product [Medioppia subpectinata]|uniref:Uncharacterized protein n=1 Tax=Medioppia subpectinata TaxID=1979941 RepID=A0A7R9L544_9ACAR|nr:unnamed protein product [Medioppia subpectinata]CAG2115519.1 unnamed protein product [Medioppia subpectinata]
MVIVPVYCIYIWFSTPYSPDKFKKLFGSSQTPFYDKPETNDHRIANISENSL